MPYGSTCRPNAPPCIGLWECRKQRTASSAPYDPKQSLPPNCLDKLPVHTVTVSDMQTARCGATAQTLGWCSSTRNPHTHTSPAQSCHSHKPCAHDKVNGFHFDNADMLCTCTHNTPTTTPTTTASCNVSCLPHSNPADLPCPTTPLLTARCCS